MRMFDRPSLLVSAFAFALGCSAGSSSSTAKDAGEDASTADGGDDSGCFPFCASSSSGGSGGDDAAADAQLTCAQLAASLAQLQAAAQACNPQLPSQCGGTTEGPCCAITISSGNDMAVAAYGSAVATYMSQCKPSCTSPICPTVPSDHCASTATGKGVCQ